MLLEFRYVYVMNLKKANRHPVFKCFLCTLRNLAQKWSNWNGQSAAMKFRKRARQSQESASLNLGHNLVFLHEVGIEILFIEQKKRHLKNRI